MQFLADLWVPILLSAVFVFIASSVLHMVIPIHKGDYQKLPGEASLLDAIRAEGVRPGSYMFPCPASMKDMASPEMVEKFRQGPVGWIRVLPNGMPNMGKSLVQWFLYSILIGVLAAYVGAHGLGPGAGYARAFQLTGAVATVGYAVGHLHDSIWKGQSWFVTLKFVFDGVVYGLLTGGTFGWLWPGSA